MSEFFYCFTCKSGFDEPRYVNADIDLGEIGIKEERWPVCPYCGSEDFAEANLCGNPDCSGAATDGNLLCDECEKKLIRKYLQFMGSLTEAETKTLNAMTEDVWLDELAEKLRKSGEWLEQRL